MADRAAKPDIIVIRDDHGNYYIMAQDTLETWRVPDEWLASAKALLGDAEVGGYALPRYQTFVITAAEAPEPGRETPVRPDVLALYRQAQSLAMAVHEQQGAGDPEASERPSSQ
jgi:hypothetical protein